MRIARANIEQDSTGLDVADMQVVIQAAYDRAVVLKEDLCLVGIKQLRAGLDNGADCRHKAFRLVWKG